VYTVWDPLFMITSSVWAIIGAANTAAPFYSSANTFVNFDYVFAPILMVQLTKLSQYIGAWYMVAPIYWWNFASCTNRRRNPKNMRFRGFFKTFFLHWCKMVSSTNILVHYKENQNVSSSSPIRLNVAHSVSWSGAETESHVFKMAATFRDKRTSITAMQAQLRAFAIFACPFSPPPPGALASTRWKKQKLSVNSVNTSTELAAAQQLLSMYSRHCRSVCKSLL
jgi:hypothetical protein